MPRRLFSLAVVAMLLVASASTYGYTAPRDLKVEFEAKEIKDKQVLFERAKKGITDLNDDKILTRGKLINVRTGKDEPARIYTTTQLLKVETLPNGSKQSSYVTTGFVVSPLDYAQYYDYNWDSTYSVKAYGTIYWNWWYDPNGVSYFDLAKVDGGWSIADSTCSLSGQYAIVAENGWVYESGYHQQTTTKYPSGLTFAYSAPSTWEPVSSSGNYQVGQTTYTRINRGGSAWDLWLEVQRRG